MNVGKKTYTISVKNTFGGYWYKNFGDDMDEAFREIKKMEEDKHFEGCRLQIIEEKVIEERVVI